MAHTEDRQLTSGGFRLAASVMTGSTGGEGVSRVIEVGSADQANQDQTLQASTAAAEMRSHGGTVQHFAVPGVPHAVGLDNPAGPAANIPFVEGRCLLIVGDETIAADYRAAVTHAAQAVYARTHNQAGVCRP